MTLGHSVVVEALGWAATATFVGSYLAKRAELLVRVQIAGALMWVVYGVLVGSAPVIAANVLVVGAAAWKARTSRPRHASPPHAAATPPAIDLVGDEGAQLARAPHLAVLLPSSSRR